MPAYTKHMIIIDIEIKRYILAGANIGTHSGIELAYTHYGMDIACTIPLQIVSIMKRAGA